MSKSIVFISHISPEKEIAIAFKELIEKSFLGMIEVFVSSDEHNIAMGQRWLENITDSLKSCAVEVVLCSPQSITRPWINFEAGAGWIRDIPVIPLCHSGMEPSKLPLPLNHLQAATANQVSTLNLVLPVLAQAIGSQTPKVDFTDFVAKVVDFELRYTFWDGCNAVFAKLNTFDVGILPKLRTGQNVSLALTETQIAKLEEIMPFLTSHNLLTLRKGGDTTVSPRGVFYGCWLCPLSSLAETLRDPNFHS